MPIRLAIGSGAKSPSVHTTPIMISMDIPLVIVSSQSKNGNATNPETEII